MAQVLEVLLVALGPLDEQLQSTSHPGVQRGQVMQHGVDPSTPDPCPEHGLDAKNSKTSHCKAVMAVRKLRLLIVVVAERISSASFSIVSITTEQRLWSSLATDVSASPSSFI
ncbi:MAG: hypothetical protein R2710_01190 [Acidimicrobiales bacterium]